MLSNGISTRLQRLQSAKQCRTCHEGPPPQTALAGAMSIGHEWPTTATTHTVVVPARNGLAADLIKKFNQMSVAASDRPATVGRSAASSKRALRKSAYPSLRMSAASDEESDSDSLTAAPEAADDSASLNYDDSHSCASVASESSTAVGEEPYAGFFEAESEASASKGTSPFLSDSELNRALLEIHEFSRNMNICLLDDEM
ncbi:hypothetical protein H4218_004297 [Coemansia sp. IMI 209128]|nr:hypothetical protein H4218_004297 [Coemansia sp. IMI 209128]